MPTLSPSRWYNECMFKYSFYWAKLIMTFFYCVNTVFCDSHTGPGDKIAGHFLFDKEENTQTKNRFVLFIFWCVRKLSNRHIRGGLFNITMYLVPCVVLRKELSYLPANFPWCLCSTCKLCSLLNGFLSWESHFWDRYLNHKLHSEHLKGLRTNHSCLFIPCFNRDKYSHQFLPFKVATQFNTWRRGKPS